MSRDPRMEANRANWDERVPIHVASDFYDVEGFRAGRRQLPAFVREAIGPVGGLDLVHLQCHFGLDTLDLARRGARVTGIDFSAPAVEAASALAAELALAARFVHGNVYDAPRLLGERFDVVFTGGGALNWLPDIRAWAAVVATLLRPGGTLALVEFHPVIDMLSDDDLTVAYNYLDRAAIEWDEPGTYADPSAATRHNRSYEWIHPLGDVVSALIDAGLRIDVLREHEVSLFARWPVMVRGEDGLWRMPAGTPGPPLMYSLRATASA